MKKGFTLIELLVVLVIIGILLGIIVPQAIRALKNADAKQCAANIRSINTAIQMCYADTRDWNQCKTLDNIKSYFPDKEVPECPFGIGYTIDCDDTTGECAVNWEEHFDSIDDLRKGQNHSTGGGSET